MMVPSDHILLDSHKPQETGILSNTYRILSCFFFYSHPVQVSGFFKGTGQICNELVGFNRFFDTILDQTTLLQNISRNRLFPVTIITGTCPVTGWYRIARSVSHPSMGNGLHHQVRQDKIRIKGLQQFEAFSSPTHCNGRISLHFQECGEDFPYRGIVINDKDRFRHRYTLAPHRQGSPAQSLGCHGNGGGGTS